jgi:hypothetical protein
MSEENRAGHRSEESTQQTSDVIDCGPFAWRFRRVGDLEPGEVIDFPFQEYPFYGLHARLLSPGECGQNGRFQVYHRKADGSEVYCGLVELPPDNTVIQTRPNRHGESH